MNTACAIAFLGLVLVLGCNPAATSGSKPQAPAGAKEWTMPDIRLPQRTSCPVIACTADELQRLRAAYASTGPEYDAVAAIVERARKNLAVPVEFPPRGGQHNQWYQCDACQMGLETVDDTHHRCVGCGKVYSGSPYDDVIFSRKHQANIQAASDAAWAWAITAQREYADQTVSILLGYAERYSGYEYHDNACRTGQAAQLSGGHLWEQTLGEASAMASHIAPAFDLIYDSPAMDATAREKIKQGLILPMLENIGRWRRGKSNWQTWHNAAMLWGGAVIGDVAWVRRALDDPQDGFVFQMKNSVTADGAWYENSWSYHFYTLSAMTALAEGARRLGIDIWSHPSLRKMYTLPGRYSMPDGSLPIFGDCTRTSAGGQNALMEPAWNGMRDIVILPLLDENPNWWSVMLGRKSIAARAVAPATSELFPVAGHAILRTNGPGKLTAAMSFGPFGGFHDHFDKLGFVFYGFGRELGVDAGRAKSQAYRLPIHKQWYRATLGHNAVLADGKSQSEASGKLELYAADDSCAIVRAAVEPWQGTTHRRSLVLTGSYLLIIDQLQADTVRTFDWLYHSHGQSAICDAASQPGTFDVAGSQFLQNIRQGRSDKTVHVEFPDKGLATHLMIDAQADTLVRTADGPRETVLQRVPMAVVSRQGRSVYFVAVIEPVAEGSAPTVKSLEVQERNGELTVTIHRSQVADVVCVESRALSVQVSGKPDLRASQAAEPVVPVAD